MATRSALLVLVAGLAGCAGTPLPQMPAELLRDELFAAPSQRISADEVFALSDAMRRYLETEIVGRSHSKGLRQALIDSVSQGQLKLEYDSATTRTAAEAFEAKAGNCLSLVIMTAAFAKELGLPVEYRSAALEELWTRSGNLYFLNGHVNVTLGKSASAMRTLYDADELMTIDFLPGRELRGLRTRVIDEPTIVAMFMSNRAAESLVRGKLDDAYWWTREAIRQSGAFLGAYNTLGVIYLRRGYAAAAEPVFRRVLEREPGNTRALANLGLALGKLGRAAESAAVYRELARIEGQAPFHFFHAGLDAMRAADFETARDLFQRELARAPYNSELHFWLGVAYVRLGDTDAAQRELSLAQEYSTTRREHDLYAAKLAYLASHRR